MSTKKILDSVFEGHNLTTIIVGDQLMWKASEISLALGYSRPDKVANLVRQEWKGEFIEEEDFVVLRGSEFATPSYGAAKREVNPRYGFSGPPVTGSRNLKRLTMLLTEQGVDLVILKTRKPAGKRLRRHLSSVVLPQLRREMIKERPIGELEARYQRELLDARAETIEASKEARKYAAMLIDHQSAWAPTVSSMKKQAAQASQLLREQKGTKKFRRQMN